jgi:hypothetical protein
MRNANAMSPVRESRHGGAVQVVLCAALAACMLFLAAQNTVLLFLLGGSIEWPPALEGVRVALGVLRVLMDAFLPWAMTGAAMFAGGALAAWGALRVVREVRHA